MASSARIDELRKKFDENPRRYFAPLANEFRKAGDLEQAVFICQEYLPQQPGHMSGHIVYGQALFELGRDEEAKAVFETALSLDPENLIALRHLGDIARQAGDLDVARFWYQRVLESDPRNEEIGQILMSMDAGRAGTASAPSEVPPPLPEPTTPAIPVEETAPVFEGAAEPPSAGEPQPEEPAAPAAVVVSEPESPESYEPFEGFDRNIDFDQAVAETVSESDTPDAADVVARANAPVDGASQPPTLAAEPEQLSSTDSSTDDLLDLDDFSIGGTSLEASSTHAAPTTPTAEVQEDDLAETELSESEAPVDAVLSSETESPPVSAIAELEEATPPFARDAFDEASATFEPDSQGATAALPHLVPDSVPEPVIELASDINLGLPGDEPAATTEFQPEPEPMTAAAEPVEATFPESAAADSPAAEPRLADSSDEAFVTETMANLYVQQGHLAGALEIYEKLLARDPGDVGLQERIRVITERLYKKSNDTVWEPQAFGEPAASPASAGAAAPTLTIREFLRGVIARRTTDAPANGTSGAVEPDPASPQPSPTDTVTGSIDALFANAEPSDDDRSAANALAQAFGEWPEPTPIHGVPAHEASSELSLDHVFKANAPVPRREDADAFSFDQFFSEESAEGGAGSEREPGSGPAGGDDIAQFNAWLNGLKKT